MFKNNTIYVSWLEFYGSNNMSSLWASIDKTLHHLKWNAEEYCAYLADRI